MKRFSLLLLLLGFSLPLSAQDSLRVMVYNLLYYGDENAYCDRDCKDIQLGEILADVQPDILAVNEVDNAGRNAERNADNLLNAVLNTGGETRWQRAPMASSSHPLLNALFFDSTRLGYISRMTSSSSFPRLDFYKLYYKSNDLATTSDTVFLCVGVLHHKAGSSSGDESQRGGDIATYMTAVENQGSVENFMMMGDFNCQGSSDAGLAPLLTWDYPGARLQDPIDSPGNWNSNNSFRNIHTQSTRTDNEADGGSNGGSDDRLDLILCNQQIMNNEARIAYATGTYQTIGQDGSFFNGSILEGSSPLKTALYRMSDHMPVALDIVVDAIPASVAAHKGATRLDVRLWPNPVSGDRLFVRADEARGEVSFRIVDLMGREQQTGSLEGKQGSIEVVNLPAGVYMVELSDEMGSRRTLRFIRQ